MSKRCGVSTEKGNDNEIHPFVRHCELAFLMVMVKMSHVIVIIIIVVIIISIGIVTIEFVFIHHKKYWPNAKTLSCIYRKFNYNKSISKIDIMIRYEESQVKYVP